MKSLLRHRCTIERSRLLNDRGFESKEWSPHLRRIRCLLQEKSGSIVKLPSGEEVQSSGIIYFSRNLDIKPRFAEDVQDRITMTRPTRPGGIFLVLFVMDESGRSDKRGFLKATVKRVLPSDPPSPKVV